MKIQLDRFIETLNQYDPNRVVRRGLKLASLRPPLPECPHFLVNGPTKIGDILADAERAAEVYTPACIVQIGKGKYSLKNLGTAELGRMLRDFV